jgi:hypothetical protein
VGNATTLTVGAATLTVTASNRIAANIDNEIITHAMPSRQLSGPRGPRSPPVTCKAPGEAPSIRDSECDEGPMNFHGGLFSRAQGPACPVDPCEHNNSRICLNSFLN